MEKTNIPIKHTATFVTSGVELAISESLNKQSIARQLIQKSMQDEIVQRCPDDSTRRFADNHSIELWGKETKTTVFSFLNEGDLAGIIFFRDKTHEKSKYDVTFAIRMYDGYRGRGLTMPFMEGAHDWMLRKRFLMRDLSPPDGIWLETGLENGPAHALFQRFGYVAVGNSGDRVIMEYDRRRWR